MQIEIKLLFIFVIQSVIFLGCTGEVKKKSASNVNKSVLTVDARVVRLSNLDYSYSYTGTLLANEEIDLRPEISARVTRINFSEGSNVKKGTLLVKMFDKDLQAQLASNRLQIDLAAKELSRKKELYNVNGISKEEFEISENKYKTLKAGEDLLLAQISKTELIAPFAGTIGLRMVSEGAYVSNATIITTLKQIDPIKIEFSIPEKFIGNINIGKEISFTIDGNDNIFLAKIYAIDSQIDANTRSIKIRALCPNPERKLFPGSFASIKLNLFPNKETIMITARATVPLIEGEMVYVVKNGVAKSVNVKTGYRNASEIEILDGLSPNDTLVINGLLQIKDGIPVKAKILKD